MPSRTVPALLLALAVVLAACTSGGDPAPDASAGEDGTADTAGADADLEEEDPDAAAADDLPVPLVEGADIDVDPGLLQAAQQWIVEESGLTQMLQEEIFLASASETMGVTHLTYVQQHGDVAVRGAQFIVHIREDGEVIGASQSLTETLPGDGTVEELDAAAAADIAIKAVPGTPDPDPTVLATWLEVGAELRLGWEVLVTTSAPPSNYTVVVDATTGEVLSVDTLASSHGHPDEAAGKAASAHPGEPASTRPGDRGVRQRTVAQTVAQAGCDAPPPPSACIFVVDPIYASGSDAITPEQANQILVGVPLDNLLDPTDGNLVGRYAQIAPQIQAQYAAPDNVFGRGGRGGGDITFEAAMTYYWIDYTQQVVQEMGFDYHADDPVDFVPIEPEFPDNAFYLFVEDRIHMGDAPDGVREAEDAQGIIHEYGHALLQAAVPNIISDEGGAFHEGFSDLVSVFTTLEFRNGDVGCLFHWAERGRCIRRIDTDLVYPQDLRFQVHQDAEIFTGAVWDVFEQALARDAGLVPSDCQDRATNPCDDVRDVVYGTLLGSLPFLTPNLTLLDAAAAFAASDAAFFGGRNAEVIAGAFAAHGLPVDASTGVQMMQAGSLMDLERTDAQIALKITHSFRGDLQVDAGVVDAAGTVLCELSLLAPDGSDGGDNVTGRFDLAGTDCEPFLPPGPDQRWVLRVADTAPEDTGTLTQFAVIHRGVRFLAGGLPLAIPDADAQGVVAVVGADVAPDADLMGGSTTPAPAASEGVEADITISHTYVGDLLVQVAVVDLASETVSCRVDVRQPDPQDASDDLALTVDLSACAAEYPPTAGRAWVLRVVDGAAEDVGQVEGFVLRGPDGVTRQGEVPAPIPDADPEGVVVVVTG